MQETNISPFCYDLRRDFEELLCLSICGADPLERIPENLSNRSDNPREEVTVTAAGYAPAQQKKTQYDALHLKKGGNQATIALDDKRYNLRSTISGKLILTK